MIGAIIDIVALALIIVSALIGLKQGFTKTFVSTFGSILAIILAILLSSASAKFLESKFELTTKISSGLENTLRNLFGAELMDTTIEQANDINLAQSGLSSLIIKIVLSIKGTSALPPDTTLNKIIAPSFAYFITVIISIAILYILLKITLFLLSELILKAHKWKIVKTADKSLGFVFGSLRAILIVQLLIMIFGLLPFGLFNSITSAISSTAITKFLSTINLFPKILSTLADTSHIIALIVGA